VIREGYEKRVERVVEFFEEGSVLEDDVSVDEMEREFFVVRSGGNNPVSVR
jgi:hypothetical protein